jgi:hypothetical protein
LFEQEVFFDGEFIGTLRPASSVTLVTIVEVTLKPSKKEPLRSQGTGCNRATSSHANLQEFRKLLALGPKPALVCRHRSGRLVCNPARVNCGVCGVGSLSYHFYRGLPQFVRIRKQPPPPRNIFFLPLAAADFLTFLTRVINPDYVGTRVRNTVAQESHPGVPIVIPGV